MQRSVVQSSQVAVLSTFNILFDPSEPAYPPLEGEVKCHFGLDLNLSETERRSGTHSHDRYESRAIAWDGSGYIWTRVSTMVA